MTFVGEVRRYGADWYAGTRQSDLWWTLAWYDVVLRYRRSMLGPLWLTISMGAMLLGMGPLYSTLFNVPMSVFFPHLTLGIIFWNFFVTVINEGCGVFIAAAAYLKQSPFPLSIFVWRCIARNVVQLAHHFVLYLPVAIWGGIEWSPNMLLLLPGAVIVIMNLHALCITCGFVCARFRDVPQIVASVLQMLMFLTPVFWFPSSLPNRTHFILYNPLAQLLDVVRLPLLGSSPAPGTWWFLLVFTLLNAAVASVVYRAYHRHLIYWL
jgi:lipopolysaccharide transport system permease protein